MKQTFVLLLILLPVLPGLAVDETASMLIAMGQIRLGDINDRITREHPDKKGVYWNIAGSAYHDFSKKNRTDVIIGISGYLDVGVIYNAGRQMVEDAGSGFAYFHKAKDQWKLVQVELSDGKKYEGYEGRDLTDAGTDQLVVYSSSGTTQIADVYRFDGGDKAIFKKIAAVHGFGEGLSIVEEDGEPLLVAYERAMIKNGDEFQIYYGRPYRWEGQNFVEDPDEFLDLVQFYDPVHSLREGSAKDLAFLENYAASHPDDFCALADCFDLSRRLGLQEKAILYRKKMMVWKGKPLVTPYSEKWIDEKNQIAQQLYLEWVVAQSKYE
jgi:hypothetical protein